MPASKPSAWTSSRSVSETIANGNGTLFAFHAAQSGACAGAPDISCAKVLSADPAPAAGGRGGDATTSGAAFIGTVLTFTATAERGSEKRSAGSMP